MASALRTTALIVAAGRGLRAGQDGLAKQYRPFAGKPVLAWSLDVFLCHPRITDVLVVIHPDDTDLYSEVVADFPPLPGPAIGGQTRQESVLNGLQHLSDMPPDQVLIHDAARPFVTDQLITHVCECIDEATGAVPARAVVETLKRSVSGVITDTVDRTDLFAVQTPQGFPFQRLLAAHRLAAKSVKTFTDDASVFEHAEGKVILVDGDRQNIKLTTQDDFTYAEAQLLTTANKARTEFRTGQGFDVHRFEAGDHVTLCGVEIPHSQTLAGHSDADVALHALTDAILGALGDGDIGTHYPPSDLTWKGADSRIFLQGAAEKVRDSNARLTHLDLIIICEAPKIGPHRDAMIASIADMIDLDPGRISVKATTSERLGFTGREEGIAAMAIATIERDMS